MTDRIPSKESIERDGTTVTKIRIRLPQARDEARAIGQDPILERAFILVQQVRALFEQEGDIRSQLIAYLRKELPQRIGRIEPALTALSDAVRDRFGSELSVLVGPSGRSGRRRPQRWERIEADGVPLLDGAGRRRRIARARL